MDVVGDASDGDEAVGLVEKLQPVLVLVTNILTELDVRDRTQAAIRARQLGIVQARPIPHKKSLKSIQNSVGRDG